MSLPRVHADFVRTRRRLATGAVVLAVGIAAVLGVLTEYQILIQRAAGLELRVEALTPGASAGSAGGKAEGALVADAHAIATALAMPWSRMLEDLESANRDSGGSVALLAIEPNLETRKVRVTAEARSLAAALSYIERLQKSHVLHDPLLDSHEIRTEVSERPVRVQITADWKLPS